VPRAWRQHRNPQLRAGRLAARAQPPGTVYCSWVVPIELAQGALIGARYRLERVLGKGGMGVVWAAEDLATHEHHALKFLKEAADDPDARRRFLREARAASAVRHPNVVSILDVLELEDGAPVIAMELLSGESLRERLAREGKLALHELAAIAVPVVSAVGTAHALGIVHRDLKPENIFLSRSAAGERVVKVLDFGIAKLTALDGAAMQSTGSTTGAVLGTPAYMAPEQVFGETDLDHRADVWALGLILYQCLSGVLPTEGDNIGQVLKNVLARPFEPLDQLVPDLPPEIARLVDRMLARERSQRPVSLHEVDALLGRWASAPVMPFGPPAARFLQADGPAPRATLAARPIASSTVAPLAATQESAPTPRPARLRAVPAGAAAAIAILGAVVAWRWTARISPLDPPGAKLACPVLRASGVEAPAGWLGAAAAAIACERARVLLGGRPERTLVPAQLLGLPHEPRDEFPRDPYGLLPVQDQTVAAARHAAQAYLDGEVTWSAAGFTVTLSLHRSDGTQLASTTGQGRGLYEAVRSAMAPLIRSDLLPKASALAPEIARWARTDNVDDALGVLDLTFAVAHNAGSLPVECRRFDELSARVHELGPEGRRLCALTLGQPAPDIALDAYDPSDAAVATRMRINHTLYPSDPPGNLDLPALFERETPWGRSFAAAIQSCLLGASDHKAALAWARRAVANAPSNPEGGTCNPWEQLTTLERDTSGARGAVRAMQAWQPWNSYAWLQPGFRSSADDPDALREARRARVLSPFDAYLADNLASSLLASGMRDDAFGVADDLRRGGLRLHLVESDLISVRVETSKALFGRALEHARREAELSPDDIGWVRTQRFEIAWFALELAVLLGRAPEVADWMVARFLDPDPPQLESNFTAVPMRVPVICALSSAPERCFERLRAVQPQLPGAVTAETIAFSTGAERYVQRDYAGAARAWRPLLGGTTALPAALSAALVDAFQRTGADDLAEQVDQEIMKRAGEFHGATLGDVRAALRAFARGDREAARRLAERVRDAWSVADEPPPALKAMRELLARLDRP